jgi:UDP-N-acetylglucosamine 1-carboxyvinyltransferase
MIVEPSEGVNDRPARPVRLRIEGGHLLCGTVQIGGAKNAALPIMAACLLTSDWCILSNVPKIEDIYSMASVMEGLGAEVRFLGPREVAIRAERITQTRSPDLLARSMRASFLVMGPLLARFGHAESPHPGGCAIGERPVNVDVRGFEAMGASLHHVNGYYVAEASRLVGRKLYLDYPSHTGTENLLMAACLAEGRTTIKHASMEPEVADLANFLVAMGASISGIGTSVLEVEGIERLHGANHTIMPDRLEAGTFLIAGVISGGEVAVSQVIPEHLDAVSYKLREVGAKVDETESAVTASSTGSLEAVEIQAIAYPGFPTDLQSAFSTLLTQAHGVSLVHERVFENRLGYGIELAKMGARFEVAGQTARITGPTPLRGADVRALDIRSGAAVVLAALAANGVTTIHDVHHLDRGYNDLFQTLVSLGAVVEAEFELPV